jgi:hypothetical protein
MSVSSETTTSSITLTVHSDDDAIVDMIQTHQRYLRIWGIILD